MRMATHTHTCARDCDSGQLEVILPSSPQLIVAQKTTLLGRKRLLPQMKCGSSNVIAGEPLNWVVEANQKQVLSSKGRGKKKKREVRSEESEEYSRRRAKRHQSDSHSQPFFPFPNCYAEDKIIRLSVDWLIFLVVLGETRSKHHALRASHLRTNIAQTPLKGRRRAKTSAPRSMV